MQLHLDERGYPVSAMELGGTTQNVAFTAASAQSTAIGGTGHKLVRLIATQDCWVRQAANPTAVTTDTFIKAGVPEYFIVKGGNKIAAIRNSADGTLNITEAP